MNTWNENNKSWHEISFLSNFGILLGTLLGPTDLL